MLDLLPGKKTYIVAGAIIAYYVGQYLGGLVGVEGVDPTTVGALVDNIKEAVLGLTIRKAIN